MLLLWALGLSNNAFHLLFDGPSLRVAVNDWSIGAFLLLHRDHESKNRWSLSCLLAVTFPVSSTGVRGWI